MLFLCAISQMDGLCQLLQQNNETLSSLEFIFCNLSSASLNAICDSLRVKDMQTYRIQHFSITNTVLERNPLSLPHGLVSFLSSGRYTYLSHFILHSLSICCFVEKSITCNNYFLMMLKMEEDKNLIFSCHNKGKTFILMLSISKWLDYPYHQRWNLGRTNNIITWRLVLFPLNGMQLKLDKIRIYIHSTVIVVLILEQSIPIRLLLNSKD